MRTVVLVLVCAVGTSGCAVSAAKGPGPGPVRVDRKPACNDGKGAVVLDGLGATVLGVSALGAFAADEGGIGAVLTLMSVGLVASAVAGSRSADRCRKAEQEWEGLVIADRDSPRRPAPPPILLDEDGDPVVVAPPRATPVAPTPVVKPPIATVPVVKPPIATAPVVKPPVATVTPPPPAAADDDAPADDATASDDPGDWSAFWREVTR